jgi:hypothetical protein
MRVILAGNETDIAQMAPTWRIRPYEPGDEEQLLTLFERTFGKARSLADWQWKFQGQQATFPYMWVAELPESGRLVGHYAGIPTRVKLGDSVVDAVVSVETMTDPDFRRQGMLTRFGEVVYDAWATAGQSLVIGMPNQQWGSRKDALGWIPLFPLAWLRFPVHAEKVAQRQVRLPGIVSTLASLPLRVASSLWLAHAWRQAHRLDKDRNVTMRPYAGDIGVFDVIWRHASPTWSNLVVRDAAWVEWRFLRATPAPYTLHVAWRGNGPVGYVAFRTSGRPDNVNGYIADIFTRHGDLAAASALVMSALETFHKDGAGLSLALAVPGTALYSLLRSLGFFKSRSQMSFSFEAVPLDAAMTVDALGAAGDWHLAGSDSDVI